MFSNPFHKEGELENTDWFQRGEGEEVIAFTHPSIIPYLDELAVAVIVILGSLVGAPLLYIEYGLIGLGALIGVLIGVGMFLHIYLHIITTWYVITSDQVFRKKGILRVDKKSGPNYDQIQSVNVNTNTLAWILNKALGKSYGDLHLSTAGKSGDDLRFTGIPNPSKFDTHIQELVEKDDE